ncbi:hypothetical protein EDB87DRAFT_1626986 [Lactarius vividus]|nr:hypothetical protein EDB87DRAFT_1626986 [Lactarius vividus]
MTHHGVHIPSIVFLAGAPSLASTIEPGRIVLGPKNLGHVLFTSEQGCRRLVKAIHVMDQAQTVAVVAPSFGW